MSSTATLEREGRTPSDAEVLRAVMDVRLRGLHTSMPGKVERYDAANQRADIQPMIQELQPTREGQELRETLSVLPNVPMLFPRSGGFFFTMPVNPGDLVTLIFNERSTDKYKSLQGRDVVDPDDFRMHSLSDAVAIPGFYPFPRRLKDSGIASNMVLGKEGGAQIHIKPDGSVHLSAENAADFVALATKVLAELSTIISDVNTLKTAMAVWIPIPSDGGAALKIAAAAWFGAPIPAPSSVAATKVRAT